MRWVYLPLLPLLVLVFNFEAAAQQVAAEDVAWLQAVATAPASSLLERPGTICPLIVDQHGHSIANLSQWFQYRDFLRASWRAFLGPMPTARPPVSIEVLNAETVLAEEGDERPVMRQLVRYEGEPEIMVEGYLLFPQGASEAPERLPGIVALHQTTDSSIDEIAGVRGPQAMMIGLKLARLGFVVFCPCCFLWQDAASLEEAVAMHQRRHPQTTGMAKMLYDAVRAVDVLESLPYVESRRIGAVGHSLGAKEVLYLMAFDDRVCAGVFSEGGLGFRSTNWNAPWYLGGAIDDEKFPLNHHQLLAMIAPRPFLVVGGESGAGAADGDRSWVLIEAALPVWKLFGEPQRLGLLNHGEGHALSDDTFEKLSQWLEVYVKRGPGER